MATITFQNLFRIYKKLSGMTGTADTEAAEFHATYKLDVVTIPTNRSIQRVDQQDTVYKTEAEKFRAVVADIMEHHEVGIPILVGTTNVDKSQALSRMLTKAKIKHQVLNAKHHENEAFVVAQAGSKGAVTVSTNMAGRGTDIVLGGNPEMLAKLRFREENRLPEAEPEAFEALVGEIKKSCEAEGDEVRELGGLYIIGTERHESRRVDNQLRGRAGRQGDPGASRFYLSLEDDLMRIFAGDRVKNLMERMGMPDDEPIEHPWVTKSVENAQKKVEERNFDIRKNLLEYDDVMNSQRKTVYTLRQQLLMGRYAPEIVDDDGKPTGEILKIKVDPEILEMVRPHVGSFVAMHLDKENPSPVGKDGKERVVGKKEIEKAVAKGAKLTELEQLQRMLYSGWQQFPGWGVKIDVEGREDQAVELYEELMELVPQALSEQRDRVLDLVDRIVGAMVEESCPPRKSPEDWDWGGVFEGFKEHFGEELPDEIAEQGDAELLARDLYARAEKILLEKEAQVGTEALLRFFRITYLQELDDGWVNHLTEMEHLRDGIGLRGYGQKDPKQEYKKEGFNIFVNMIAKTSSNVVSKLFGMQARPIQEEREDEELELLRHAEELARLVARHESALPPGAAADSPAQEGLLGGEQECPCGSGRPFSVCHGVEELVDGGRDRAEVEDEDEAVTAAPAAVEERAAAQASVEADQECICGSGKPFKQCHGKEDEEPGGAETGGQEARL